MLDRASFTSYLFLLWEEVKMLDHKLVEKNEGMYCRECSYLKPKEQPHITGHTCIKYGVAVFHNGHHPEIIKSSLCCKLPKEYCVMCKEKLKCLTK